MILTTLSSSAEAQKEKTKADTPRRDCVDHTYFELEGLGHQRTKMIKLLRAIWFNYHMESLRRAAIEAGKSR